MKKLLALLVALLCLLAVASAEDLSTLSLEELTAKRQALIEELTQVNAVRGSMIRQQVKEGVDPDEVLGRIIDLFPDEELALIIRNQCGKFSIEQSVTQADLDRIEMLTCVYNDIHDFTGIRYLRNMWYFHTDAHYDGAFPDELRYCRSLKSLYITSNQNVTVIPNWIDELANLETLELYGDNIVQLPEAICNLTRLKRLDVSSNKGLVSLPANMGNLVSLQQLIISYTAITELPDSIWNLSLSYFGADGLPIK